MNDHTKLPVRVAIVEDDALLLASLSTMVNSAQGFSLSATFSQKSTAIEWLSLNPVDMLLTDIGLPDGSGIEVIQACATFSPSADIMVISMFGDEKNVLSAIEAGATGYLLKDSEPINLHEAIEYLHAGGSPMSPMIARKVLERARQNKAVFTASPPKSEDLTINLTGRETETLNLIARGYTYEESAQLLGVSLATIQTHIRGIYGKLSVHSRSEAVFEAHKLGLLQNGLLDP